MQPFWACDSWPRDCISYGISSSRSHNSWGFLLAREVGGWRRARTRERRAIMFRKGFAWGMVATVMVVLGYRLISLWPINKRSGPKTPFENTGLSETLQHPDRRYSEVVMNGPDTFLQAVYADRAVSQACIGCHNAHPDSPKRDFKLNDVIGGMIITVPLKNQ